MFVSPFSPAECGLDKIDWMWQIDSFFSLFYNSGLWKENLAPIGAIENWLKADKRASLPPFITEEVCIHIYGSVLSRNSHRYRKKQRTAKSCTVTTTTQSTGTARWQAISTPMTRCKPS